MVLCTIRAPGSAFILLGSSSSSGARRGPSVHRLVPVTPDRRWIMKQADRILLVLALVVALVDRRRAPSGPSRTTTRSTRWRRRTRIAAQHRAARPVRHLLVPSRWSWTSSPRPVMKNGEPILDPGGPPDLVAPRHPDGQGWDVGVDNQFGFHSWHVGDVALPGVARPQVRARPAAAAQPLPRLRGQRAGAPASRSTSPTSSARWTRSPPNRNCSSTRWRRWSTA